MKIISVCLTVAVVCLMISSSNGGFFNKASKHLYKSESDCEKYAQSLSKCGQSANQCRSCCHFDLERLNNRYQERRYHIKDVLYVGKSGECVCVLCKKYVEDFNNAAYF